MATTRTRRADSTGAEMEYLHQDLGSLHAGDTVQVDLAYAANVRLLDEVNYRAFNSGRAHRALGGYATRSPVLLTAPTAGRWHVVVDLGGAAGRVGASVRVIKRRAS
jgi:hypothetical protein